MKAIGAMKKAEIVAELQSLGVQVEDGTTKVEAAAALKIDLVPPWLSRP